MVPHERGYLAYVWETVGRAALAQVLGNGKPGAASAAIEEDARLTALFLWTLQATKVEDDNGGEASGAGDDEDPDGDEEAEGPSKRKAGATLPFDVVRRFAQPLGIRLPDWEDRIIETDKGIVRLLPVKERAKQLFGDEGAEVVADELESAKHGKVQLTLFPNEAAAPKAKGGRKKGRVQISDEALGARREATTLDRVHAAMLLQASGRAAALRALLKAEQERGPEFLRLANALSALYPDGSEEERLVDAMLLAMPK
jgi:hypothetical protein